MSLSSSSTYAEIETEWKDTANYQANDSRSEALRHAVACDFLALETPERASKGPNSITHDTAFYREAGERARAFALSKGPASGSRIIRGDFRQMRSY